MPVFTLHLNSDAGYADLPLTLLGAPVNIGEARGDVLWPEPRLYCLSPSPGTVTTMVCFYRASLVPDLKRCGCVCILEAIL